MAAREQPVSGGRTNGYTRLPVKEVRSIPLPDGDTGEGVALLTERGQVTSVLHTAWDSKKGVIWVCGARGGFGGPGPGLYAQLAQEFTEQGITSLRLDYRVPNDLRECAMDLMAGVTYLEDTGHDPGGHRRSLLWGSGCNRCGRSDRACRRGGIAVATDLRREHGRPGVTPSVVGSPRQG